MPNQTIAITLTWGPAQGQLSDYDLNQLGTLLAAHLSAAVDANVTFIPQLVNNPAAFDTQLIFNITQRLFQGWDAGTGKYLPVTEYRVGDVKNSFVGVDDIARGWVLLNGRAISAITGITGAQQTALESIFGVGGSLPTVKAANVNGIPADGAFGNIPYPASLDPVFTPADGVIAALTFTDPATGPEAEALRDETEILRDSAADLETVVADIQAQAEFLLNALNNNSAPTPLYSLVFCGYA